MRNGFGYYKVCKDERGNHFYYAFFHTAPEIRGQRLEIENFSWWEERVKLGHYEELTEEEFALRFG